MQWLKCFSVFMAYELDIFLLLCQNYIHQTYPSKNKKIYTRFLFFFFDITKSKIYGTYMAYMQNVRVSLVCFAFLRPAQTQ